MQPAFLAPFCCIFSLITSDNTVKVGRLMLDADDLAQLWHSLMGQRAKCQMFYILVYIYSHTLFILMESQVKFHHPQNNSRAPQQNSVAEVDWGLVSNHKQQPNECLHAAHPRSWRPWNPMMIWKVVFYPLNTLSISWVHIREGGTNTFSLKNVVGVSSSQCGISVLPKDLDYAGRASWSHFMFMFNCFIMFLN